MRSVHHLLVSLVVGVAVVPLVALPAPLVVGVAAALGVGVDADHFLVARYNSGSWRALREGLRHPRRLVFDQNDLFEAGEVWPLQRLLTHALLAGAVVAGLVPVAPALALVAGVTLYVHVLADLLWDNYRHRTYLERAARTAGGD